MGLKIRRLKGGFAYYAEYKFGGQCVYETIKAGSVREAKRAYAARMKELRAQLSRSSATKPISRRDAHESQVNAVVGSLLQALIGRGVLSAGEARDLIDNAFTQLDALQTVATLAPGAVRAREAIRRELLAKFSEPAEAPPLVLQPTPAARVPQVAAPFGVAPLLPVAIGAAAPAETSAPGPTDLVPH